jgi:peptide chain release factor 1
VRPTAKCGRWPRKNCGTQERIEKLEQQIEIMLLPKDAADERSAILEIRAGTGGSEAALFAGDLFRMYERYAASQGWKVSRCFRPAKARPAATRKSSPPFPARACLRGSSSNPACTGFSGFRRPSPAGVFIHRRRRSRCCPKPRTSISKSARRYSDRHDAGVGRRRPARQHHRFGGSYHHIPTGLVVTSSEKSQHQNRARAMQVLRARLYDMERQSADDERSQSRRSQVGSGDRSERIRTYNFPQGRVTDHRINLTLYKLDRMMMGEIDEVVDALISDHQAGQLATLGDDGQS